MATADTEVRAAFRALLTAERAGYKLARAPQTTSSPAEGRSCTRHWSGLVHGVGWGPKADADPCPSSLTSGVAQRRSERESRASTPIVYRLRKGSAVQKDNKIQLSYYLMGTLSVPTEHGLTTFWVSLRAGCCSVGTRASRSRPPTAVVCIGVLW